MTDNEVQAAENGATQAAFRKKFVSRFLSEAGETELPSPLTFANNLCVRLPALWILVWESREVQEHHFSTLDEGPGKLTLAFEHAVTRVFSGKLEPPWTLPKGQCDDAALLVAEFAALGARYCYTPINMDGPDAAIDTLVRVLRPGILTCERLIRSMNARGLTDLGYSGERYLTARLADPALFGKRDAECIKRATMRSEATLHTAKRDREEDPSVKEKCTICSKEFIGSWSKHKRSGGCTT